MRINPALSLAFLLRSFPSPKGVRARFGSLIPTLPFSHHTAMSPPPSLLLLLLLFLFLPLLRVSLAGFAHGIRSPPLTSHVRLNESLTYLWPLPSSFRHGNATLILDPDLSLQAEGPGGNSSILKEAFERYRSIIFQHHRRKIAVSRVSSDLYDVRVLKVVVASADEELQLAVDESYALYVDNAGDAKSIVAGATIEANTVYGALRGLETFSQLCTFNYKSKVVEVYKAPWYIEDEPRFAFRGLLIDTSRHYLPIPVIKQVIESMSYAKLNVLHWHMVDEESFPIEVPSYPRLWRGSYTKWERYTIEDASEIVEFAKGRGINVMAEVDVPGHGESWGTGYPDLWPSPSCREPLDISKNFTFEVISGILSDLRRIFPFGLFHLGGDEVDTECWNSTQHVKQWLEDRNMTVDDAYQYFVLSAQKLALSLNWTPVNWEETFISFGENLNPKTVVHNWLNSGICPKAVAKGYKCIFSNQGIWYLDHLDVPWEQVYGGDPLEGIDNSSEQKLVIGGEVCMWGETADSSDLQQTIWPRAAAAAERLWTTGGTSSSSENLNSTVLPRLEYFRCLLNRRGIAAAPVTNFYARNPPVGPGSCYEQ